MLFVPFLSYSKELGIFFQKRCQMLKYNRALKNNARQLRKNMTDAEQLLWYRLRRKQLLAVQFNRQKPIGPYIVDFYASKAKLVIEIDGSQHAEFEHKQKDAIRDNYLHQQGLTVLRFNNRQILQEIDEVVELIIGTMKGKNPP